MKKLKIALLQAAVWKPIIIAFLLFISLSSLAADTTLSLQISKTISGSFSNFYTDNLQNIYVISSSTDQIKKLNSNGDSIVVFNNIIRYGKIWSADVTNPLKIVVFYKDFSTIVILDRFLSTRTSIDLRKLQITQVKAVALSYDSNIWLYDEGEGKIKKIDENGNVLLESADLRLVFDESLNPVKIIDNNGQLYLYDNKLGWLVFDYYTAFKKRLSFTGWKDVSANDNLVTGRDETHFFFASQNDIDFHSLQINISLADVIKTERKQNKMYVLTKDELNIYNIIP